MKTRISAFAVALSASTLTLSPAMAADGQERSASVAYADLNLASEAGLAELDRRIDIASRRVCAYDAHQVSSRIRSAEARACYADARRSFEEQFAAIVTRANYGG